MSTESKNKWRRLHELCLRVKEAKDFETLGAAIEELAALEFRQKMTASATNDLLKLITGALWQARNKMCQWQDSPPPLGPVEAPIGPGNPLPPPPPPDKIVLTPEEVYVALNEGVGGVSLGAGDGPIYTAHAERLNALIAKKLSDANRHTIAHAKPWTAEEFDRLIEAPYHKHAKAFKDLQGWQKARAETCARIINERCGLIDGDKPTDEKPLKAKPEAAEAPNVERSPSRAETPGESLYKILQRAVAPEPGSLAEGWPILNAATRAYYERAAEWMFDVCRSKAKPMVPLIPWTGERYFFEFESHRWANGVLYAALNNDEKRRMDDCANAINAWAGITASEKKSDPAEPLQRKAKYLREELTSFSDHTLVHVYELEFGRGKAAAQKRDGIIEELLGLRK